MTMEATIDFANLSKLTAARAGGFSEPYVFESVGEEQTVAFARALAAVLENRGVIALHGELGAGKTRFAQGLALSLGVATPVASPTFALISEYEGQGGRRFVHMDLYRVSDADEVAELGFEDLVEHSDLVAIEWPEVARDLLPPDTIHVRIEHGPGNHRKIQVYAN